MPKRTPKPKTLTYELIAPDSVLGHPMYDLLDELVQQHHDELRHARIALAWCTSWKPDVDGRITLGKCKKASDLDREISDYDFIVLLSRAFWRDPRVTDLQRRALLDHELSHAAMKFDPSGEPVEDARGRLVYRTRKHDLEEFTAIVERYGCYKRDIELFAAALRRSPQGFAGCEVCRDGTPGWVTSVDAGGHSRMARCACFVEWAQIRAEVVAS